MKTLQFKFNNPVSPWSNYITYNFRRVKNTLTVEIEGCAAPNVGREKKFSYTTKTTVNDTFSYHDACEVYRWILRVIQNVVRKQLTIENGGFINKNYYLPWMREYGFWMTNHFHGACFEEAKWKSE